MKIKFSTVCVVSSSFFCSFFCSTYGRDIRRCHGTEGIVFGGCTLFLWMVLSVGFVGPVKIFDFVHCEGLRNSHRLHLQATPVDFTLALQSFGIVHGHIHVWADDNGAVVPHENCVVLSEAVGCDFCQVLGTVGVVVGAFDCCILDERFFTDGRSSVGIRKVNGTKQFTNCVVSWWKGYPAAGQCARVDSVGVHNCTHVWSCSVNCSVKLEFAGGFVFLSRHRISIHVAMDNLFGLEIMNLDSRRCD
mmetsp:Transcript_369/g.838  ORF Transcript_369/g.838 Transcript_369/m.838 type:complete len:247 (+) Transcript_369:88-828(+)